MPLDDDFTAGETHETLTVTGQSGNVLEADAEAWLLLESVLGRDPVRAWSMVEMEHSVVERGVVEWTATFLRDQAVEVPPLTIAAELPELEPQEASS